MFRKSIRALVTYGPVRYTKDGRVRAPRILLGPHNNTTWPKVKKFMAFTAFAYSASIAYAKWQDVPIETQFLRKLAVRPYGVLGTAMVLTGSNIRVADEPDETCAIVDPTSLEYLQATADDAANTSGAIYKWAGITGRFPKSVSEGVFKVGDAKWNDYDGKAIIHVVTPDFRIGNWTEREATLELARAYRNLFHEFVMSGRRTLRIPPLANHLNAGDLYNSIPPLTQQALISGFDQLHPFDKEYVLKSRIELCIYQEREWDKFATVFTMLEPAKKLS
jgi:hypothetical protein